MKTLAAVLVETGKPLVLAELEVPALKPGQVLVDILVSGVCHTQVLECRGHRGPDRYLPHCLGHEGVGAVLEAGPGVFRFRPGQRVLLSWMKGSGLEGSGTRYRWAGREVNAGSITTFGRQVVVSENRLSPLPEEIGKLEAAWLGCAVPTGLGMVFNTARALAGQSLAVFGTGGIGLCAVAGAALAGCSPIIAVDLRTERLELARELGATHAIPASEADPVERIRVLCPGGVDIAVEASGRPEAMRRALESVRERGGSAVVAGNSRHGERLELDPRQLNLGKRLLGTWGGDNEPDRDFPKYRELLVSGKLRLEPLLSRAYRLEEINRALEDLEAGRAVRPLVDMSL